MPPAENNDASFCNWQSYDLKKSPNVTCSATRKTNPILHTLCEFYSLQIQGPSAKEGLEADLPWNQSQFVPGFGESGFRPQLHEGEIPFVREMRLILQWRGDPFNQPGLCDRSLYGAWHTTATTAGPHLKVTLRDITATRSESCTGADKDQPRHQVCGAALVPALDGRTRCGHGGQGFQRAGRAL